MASRAALSQPLTLGRASRVVVRPIAFLVVILLAVAMFTLGRATASNSPVKTTPVPQALDTSAEVAQFNALLNTPEGIKALARELGPDNFGQAVISSSGSTTAAAGDCPHRPVC